MSGTANPPNTGSGGDGTGTPGMYSEQVPSDWKDAPESSGVPETDELRSAVGLAIAASLGLLEPSNWSEDSGTGIPGMYSERVPDDWKSATDTDQGNVERQNDTGASETGGATLPTEGSGAGPASLLGNGGGSGGGVLRTFFINEEQVREVALAVAKQHYLSNPDHPVGSFDVGLNAALEPRGWVGTITHRLEADGAALTTISFEGDLPPRDVIAMLPGWVQDEILQLVPLPGSAKPS